MRKNNRSVAINAMARRELRSTLFGYGIYVAIALGMVVASFLLYNYVGSIQENGVLVMPSSITQTRYYGAYPSAPEPMQVPLKWAVYIGAIYITLSASMAISRERDNGTLEVLFYGPVDSISFIIAKFVEQILAFAVILLFYVLYFVLMSQISNFALSSGFGKMLLLSLLLAGCMAAFGIFLSSFSRKVRTSVILFLVFTIIFLTVPVVHEILMTIPDDEAKGAISIARQTTSYLNAVITWVSPFAYLERGATAIELGSVTEFLKSLVFSLIYTVVLLVVSIGIFNKKGVRR
jgi:ABC-type transport system involved in multi-copper enzyme maturation permease subunit